MTLEVKKRAYKRMDKSIKQSHENAIKLQTDLECFLLSLLSQRYGLTVTQPQKKTKDTKQFIKIKEIIEVFENGDEFNFQFQKFLKVRSSEYITQEVKKGVSRTTAQRRMQDLKHIESTHFFEDLLGDNWIIEAKNEDRDGIHGDIAIYYNSLLVADTKTVKTIGSAVYNYIMNSLGMKNERYFVIGELSIIPL
ncbi:hypothetical protein EIN_173960 [Entamoeba invadens IP1]|uniref:Uncharacterized protein n=1 Tax=Entamoeba invadens IP1 TaxID=370355 RepID=A0A0A1TW62_ENTIV|nr:hypothetical protein EIN_173960 [Entamoeba invadens IP1]ELP84721.1 hypothetical protein EIN_173960 [Entamoeba invadens IP1]|eukprot:XP_004184067.1 hypothetical protein EIN_173960 [Entamoeba invadens IP1]